MILNVDFRLNGVCRRDSSGERQRNLNLNFLTYNQLTQKRFHNKNYDGFVMWFYVISIWWFYKMTFCLKFNIRIRRMKEKCNKQLNVVVQINCERYSIY